MPHANRSAARRRIVRHAVALAALSLCGAIGARSVDAAETVRFIVPFPAGGAADSMGRALVEKLKDELKRTVIVENRPGASTRLAAEVLKQSAPDGNTVLMTLLDTMVIAPMVYSKLRYDPDTDFAPITEVAGVKYGVAVNAAGPYKTLEQYVAAARADHDQAKLGVSGLGSTLHFLAFDFAAKTKADLSIVPFQGGPQMVTNLLGNHIPAIMDGLGVFAEHHRNGRLRVLAVSGDTRSSQLPDVPTFAELGYPSLVVGSSYVLYAPAGTPAAQIDKWNQAMRKVLAMPEVRAKLQTIGYEPLPGSSPAEVVALTRKTAEHWAPIVKATNFQGD